MTKERITITAEGNFKTTTLKLIDELMLSHAWVIDNVKHKTINKNKPTNSTEAHTYSRKLRPFPPCQN